MFDILYIYFKGSMRYSKLLQSCLTLLTLWTIAHQPPLSMGFSRKEILKWVAMHFSKGSFQPTDRICIAYVSWIGRWVLYREHHLGSL